MLGFKRFFNARRVLSGVELVQKIIRGQFGLPESFGTDPFQVWSKRRISLHISARVKLCRKWTVETNAKQNMGSSGQLKSSGFSDGVVTYR